MKRCPSCERDWPDDFRLCPTDGAPLQPAGPATDLTDTVLGDRYHIQSRIGEGGMGTVWAAEHLRTGQLVAVKVMAPALTMDPTSVARFHREARNAARIRHPNVCIVHDFGETDDHLTYLDFPGGRFTVPRRELPEGSSVRLRVLARDVSLTLERQSGTSILNILPVRVTAMTDESPAQVMIRLDAAGIPLLARITHRSARALALEPGSEVWAQIKSVAILP